MNASQLYSDVGQFTLALGYAQTVIDENWVGRGVCKGGRLKEDALYLSGRFKAVGPELENAISECVRVGEILNANALRITAAKAYIEQKKFDDAVRLLQEHYEEVRANQIRGCSPCSMPCWRMLIEEEGVPSLARQFAGNVVGTAVKEFDEQLVTAYRVLYEIAKDQGDFKAALGFHEQFAAADKAYLDDLSARHLAYQKVNHENIANKLQVEALNKQNHVLQLEHELSGKAVETSRLYISLLTMSVVFIGLWAYRTKRSQLHFQSLSRLDGLTGICNRPHFIEQAEKALDASRRTGEPIWHHSLRPRSLQVDQRSLWPCHRRLRAQAHGVRL